MTHPQLLMLVPSRSRPDNARRLAQACCDTASSVRLVVGIDADDPTSDEYLACAADPDNRLTVWVIPAREPRRPGMVAAVNDLCAQFIADHPFVGFMGDDHLPRTQHWDCTLCDAIRAQGGGIAYGNDLIQREKLPTAVVMDAQIPRRLGYFAPPALAHLYVDNAWLDWGKGLGKVSYFDDVIIEHLHPVASKAPWDPGYESVNNNTVSTTDHDSYQAYVNSGELAADVAKLRAPA